MGKTLPPRKVLAYLTGPSSLFLLLLTGCSTTPGQSFTLAPTGHRLLQEAKDLRQPEMPLPLPRELTKQLHGPYLVEPGDVLLVQPADLDSPVRLPSDQPVLPDGTIDLGRYGRPVVAGRRVEEIEEIVKASVQAQNKEAGPINVRLVGRQSKVYYVLGEVNNPGSFPVNGRETVLDALLAAGGLTERASRENIILSRPSPPDGCRTVLPICYLHIVQLGDTTTNYQLLPGDRVFVATRGFCEGLFPKQAKCSPCNAVPQVPCPSPGVPCGPPAPPPPPGPSLGSAVPAMQGVSRAAPPNPSWPLWNP